MQKYLIHLETSRLILRQWKADDYTVFSEINSDPCVMKYFPKLSTRIESNILAKKIKSFIEKNGWGMWAVEIKSSGKFIGFVGLNKPKLDLPPSPCVEISWRIARKHWGRGYAAEAAKQSLSYAFNTLRLEEVVAYTALNNKGSLAVMDHIGMIDTGNNFMHPNINLSSILCEHVLYKITKNQWANN